MFGASSGCIDFTNNCEVYDNTACDNNDNGRVQKTVDDSMIMASIDILFGYTETVCVKCTYAGGGTVKLKNWVVE